MIVPIFLFSGLTNYGTQTLSTIHVAYYMFFCMQIIPGALPVYLFLECLFLEQYFYCALRPPSIAITLVCFKLL